MKGNLKLTFGLACAAIAGAAHANYWSDMGSLSGGFSISGGLLTAQNSATNTNGLSFMPNGSWLPILGGSQGQFGVAGQFGVGAASSLPVMRYNSVTLTNNQVGTGDWGMENYSNNLSSSYQPSDPLATIGHTHIRGAGSSLTLDGSGNLEIIGNSDGYYYWYLNNAQTLFNGLSNGAGGTFTGRYRIIGTLDAQSGYANLSNGKFQVESTPEPTTWAALGLGAVAVMRRRKAK